MSVQMTAAPGVDTTQVKAPDIRDAFNPKGAYRPHAYRLHPLEHRRVVSSRPSLLPALAARVRQSQRSPRPRVRATTTSRRGPPSPSSSDDDPDHDRVTKLAADLLGRLA